MSRTGTDLNDYVTAVPGAWSPGDLLHAGGLPAYRLRGVIPLTDLDYDVCAGIWEARRTADTSERPRALEHTLVGAGAAAFQPSR